MIKISELTARWVYFFLGQTPEATAEETEIELHDQLQGTNGDAREVLVQLWEQRCGEGFQGMAKTPADLRDELAQQLLRPMTDQDEVTLVERIIQLLSNPYARNVLSGKTLDKLRKALLNPEEINKLLAKTEEAAHHCAHCGKEFQLGEIAVNYSDLVTGSSRAFYCVRCRKPSGYACQGASCDGAAEFKYDFKKKCANHREGASEVAPAENPFQAQQGSWGQFLGLGQSIQLPRREQASGHRHLARTRARRGDLTDDDPRGDEINRQGR